MSCRNYQASGVHASNTCQIWQTRKKSSILKKIGKYPNLLSSFITLIESTLQLKTELAQLTQQVQAYNQNQKIIIWSYIGSPSTPTTTFN